MVDEPSVCFPVEEGVLQGVQDELRLHGASGPPADDAAPEDIDDEGDIEEGLQCADVGEVRDPQPVRLGAAKVRCTRSSGHGAPSLTSPVAPSVLARRLTSQAPMSRAVVQRHHLDALSHDLPPDLPHAVEAVVLLQDPPHLGLERLVALDSRRSRQRLGTAADVAHGMSTGRWAARCTSARPRTPLGARR